MIILAQAMNIAVSFLMIHPTFFLLTLSIYGVTAVTRFYSHNCHIVQGPLVIIIGII
jgi:hypothetical protein